MTERPHILFVDDEPRILGGLRRMLRSHRDRWDMTFAEGAEAALATLKDKPCDVIVSDYRMPGMDGAELLELVRTDYPGTARVILSGQTNEDNLLRIMLLAHEFLTKPSTPEQLLATVERLIGMRTTSTPEASKFGGTFVESLPSAPNTLIELMAALDNSDASAQSVGAVIEHDPAAVAKVLHLVNSSAYSAGRTVSNVSQAVALLGLHTVRGLVVMHDLINTFDVAGPLPIEWIDGLTSHAVETSRLIRRLAQGREWENHAFTAGLLHEVGALALASSQPATYVSALSSWRSQDSAPDAGEASLRAVEVAAFGVSHVEVGANLLARWGLPAPVVEAVACHAGTAVPAAATDPSSAVALAHMVVEAALGPVCGPHHDAPGLDEDRWDEPTRDAVSRWRQEHRPH